MSEHLEPLREPFGSVGPAAQDFRAAPFPIFIEILLFAQATQLTGVSKVEVKVLSGSTIRELERNLIAQFPVLSDLAALSRWAVGVEFVGADFIIQDPIQVAMIPPVSGG